MKFNKGLFLIQGEMLTLKLIDTYNGNTSELPFYWYEIILNPINKPIGKISIRIGHNSNSYYNGNIGYEIDKEYRGHSYAFLACKMILTVAKHHNMDKINLTCNYNNIASYKTIEKLGAQLIEIVTPPKDYAFYYANMPPQRIYQLDI